MATYAELAQIRSDDTQWGDFLAKVRVASDIKAAAIIDTASPGATALEWAKGAIADPVSAGNELVGYVVAKNQNASIQQIYDASDSQIQANVDNAVDAIYGT